VWVEVRPPRRLPALLTAGLLAALAPGAAGAEEAPPIRDNSFLVEEAYNQEPGVVQHISNFAGYLEHRDWVSTFTQEWPVFTQRHQLSYTLSLTDPGNEDGGQTGFGDFLVNYRYQVLGGGPEDVAFAPRLSVILPTGDEAQGRGTGGFGAWVHLPLSVEWGRSWVTHSNAGVIRVWDAGDESDGTAELTDYLLGQSVIWLARPAFNVMLEAVWASTEEVVGPGLTERTSELFLNPGLRWAINLPSGLQIVPGISVPLGAGPSRGEEGLLLYLSFEHPFTAANRSD
jgi:hypothetical protein